MMMMMMMIFGGEDGGLEAHSKSLVTVEVLEELGRHTWGEARPRLPVFKATRIFELS
jgi:hypothetical protein